MTVELDKKYDIAIHKTEKFYRREVLELNLAEASKKLYDIMFYFIVVFVSAFMLLLNNKLIACVEIAVAAIVLVPMLISTLIHKRNTEREILCRGIIEEKVKIASVDIMYGSHKKGKVYIKDESGTIHKFKIIRELFKSKPVYEDDMSNEEISIKRKGCYITHLSCPYMKEELKGKIAIDCTIHNKDTEDIQKDTGISKSDMHNMCLRIFTLCVATASTFSISMVVQKEVIVAVCLTLIPLAILLKFIVECSTDIKIYMEAKNEIEDTKKNCGDVYQVYMDRESAERIKRFIVERMHNVKAREEVLEFDTDITLLTSGEHEFRLINKVAKVDLKIDKIIAFIRMEDLKYDVVNNILEFKY